VADVVPVVDALRRRFPELVQPIAEDICYATRNRQAAIQWLARAVDVVLIVGDAASSNSRRLCEAAAATGTSAHLISRAADIGAEWLTDARVVGVSAGASSPEDLVRATVARLCRTGAVVEERTLLEERVTFRLPAEVAAAGH
jgi:4-hydroxy-3-methylbut-2-enyl diphosphate reductase